jgi:hypothetical protein
MSPALRSWCGPRVECDDVAGFVLVDLRMVADQSSSP